MLEIEKLSKRSGNTDASITNRIQEMEDRISNVEDTIEEIDSTVKENTKTKKAIKQNVQEIKGFLCSFGTSSVSHSVDQSGFNLTDICLAFPSECRHHGRLVDNTYSSDLCTSYPPDVPSGAQENTPTPIAENTF
ncbi:hypothetical protein STEG23_020334 [Scotinomys teguina]